MRAHPTFSDVSPIPLAGALALALLAFAGCNTGRYVPVHTGVAAMHHDQTPECRDVVTTSGPMSVSRTAYVRVEACGTRTTYVCTTDTVPKKNSAAHARAQCAPIGSLRASEIETIERRRQNQERGRQDHPMTHPTRPPAHRLVMGPGRAR